MTPGDFSPREYVDGTGTLRVYRVGVLWYADARSDAGEWCPVVEHCISADCAMVDCLRALDLLDEHEEPESLRADDIEW